MEARIKDLLTKIDFPLEMYSNFENATITKIIAYEEKDTWDIYIKNDTNFKYEVISLFLDKLSNFVNRKYTYNIIINTNKEDFSLFSDYYKQILILINNNNLYYNMFCDRLINKDEAYYIEVYNKAEEITLSRKLDTINKYFKNFGFNTTVNTYLNLEKGSLIKEEIDKDLIVDDSKFKVTAPVKEEKPKEFNYKEKRSTRSANLFGVVSGNVTSLNDISYELDNIVVEVKVFGIVPPTKKGFYGFTLKVTDYTTSMYVRIFARSEEEYEKYISEFKEGMWIKIAGYVKNNTFYNDFVINARTIEKIDKKEKKPEDNEEVKRVELHAHTMMSQMDGVMPVKDLIKRAISYGHKAIAITDHNGIQTFPEASHFKNDIKILFGVELNMIDDDIDLVIRPNDMNLLDQTYVVFDFETTGFNAGGGDSIIEVGAVKIKNGEIIESFDRLINPGRKLEEHIVNLTHITDEMLSDCPTEEEIIKEFIDWTGDLPMVAHNAKFDASFLSMAYQKYNFGEFKNPVLDTLQMSRAIDTGYSRHSLSALVKRYDIEFDESGHHRADYDALATAKIFHQMLLKLKARKIEKMSDIDLLVSHDDIHKFGEGYHINILIKNIVGLKNLFKILSYANTKYLYKTPRILRSEIEKHREGLLISSGCANSEIFRLARSKSEEEVSDLMNFYDYIEVQPPEVYSYLIDLSDFNSVEDIHDNIKKIIKVANEKKKMVVATSDAHHLDRNDKIYREFIVNQKVPGGGRHPLNRKEIKSIPSMHFRTTKEMLDDFAFLGKEESYKIVVENSNLVADMIEDFEIIPDTKGIPFSPKFEDSDKTIRNICYTKANSIYGDPLPPLVHERLESELNGIINGGFDSIYLISQKLVEKSNKDGYVVGSRGSVGSSFVATMLGISEVNPLPAHYVCPNCKKSIFENEEGTPYGKDYPSGYDLPDRKCECGSMMKKEGQDMPFATFLGFNADKVPDIDLNFSGDYQARAHDYTKVLFGADHVFRAGTIGTVAEKTAFGFVKGYYEDRGIEGVRPLEIERLAQGVTGVKRTTGQHPGGIVVVPDYKEIYDFTPYQYPADDINAEWATTHFNYHDIEDCLLKLDILGHDNPTIFKMLHDLTKIDPQTVPMDDKEVMSLFTSTKALGVTPEQIECEVGCVGLPEFTRFVIGIVLETKPTTFAELVKISGLSHGTDVWNGNAQDLVKNNICPFKETIGCRDDIMVYLSNHGIKPLDAFKIMELVRKGRQKKMKDKWDEYKKLLKDNNIPDWYIDSCDKIKYMFPKAHATAYVSAAWRIAWYKINRAIEYYATFFSIKCFSFDLEVMEMGYDKIKERLAELRLKKFGLTVKEQDLISTLEVALEMTARGFKFGGVDLYKSHSKNFVIDEDGKTLIPPFRALDGLGDTVANNIVEQREIKEFLSIEDLQKRGKISGTLIEKMRIMGILRNLPESSQISLFDLM